MHILQGKNPELLQTIKTSTKTNHNGRGETKKKTQNSQRNAPVPSSQTLLTLLSNRNPSASGLPADILKNCVPFLSTHASAHPHPRLRNPHVKQMRNRRRSQTLQNCPNGSMKPHTSAEKKMTQDGAQRSGREGNADGAWAEPGARGEAGKKCRPLRARGGPRSRVLPAQFCILLTWPTPLLKPSTALVRPGAQ